jgi:uncharacterized membrane protein YbhN (UPF0104 family)
VINSRVVETVRTRSSRAATLLKVAVSAGILTLIVRNTGIVSILRTIANADPWWLLLGLALGILASLVQVSQWWALLRANGLPRTWRRCLRLEWASNAFDAVLPSSVGGDVHRAVKASERPDERARAAATVVLRRLCNFPGMIVLMAAGLLGSLGLRYSGRVAPYALAGIVGGVAGMLVCASPLLGWFSRHPALQRRKPGRAVAQLLGALHQFRGQRRDLVLAFLRGGLFWLFVVFSQWCYMRAVGVHAEIIYAAVVVPATSALAMLPISLGGFGVREGGFSAFLAVGGLATTSQGVAVGLCVTGQTLLFGLVGLVVFLTLPRGTSTAGVSLTEAAA